MLGIEIRIAQPDELHESFDLRWRVLRKPLGEPRGSEQDEFDTDSKTIHGAAFIDGMMVSTGRIHVASHDPLEMQVRYMATDEAYRGQEIGGKVLSVMEQVAYDLSPKPSALMLNARIGALSLYMRAGYKRASNKFESHGIPHYRMRKELDD